MPQAIRQSTKTWRGKTVECQDCKKTILPGEPYFWASHGPHRPREVWCDAHEPTVEVPTTEPWDWEQRWLENDEPPLIGDDDYAICPYGSHPVQCIRGARWRTIESPQFEMNCGPGQCPRGREHLHDAMQEYDPSLWRMSDPIRM